ncbi:hypothetical protein, partial [Natronobacterium gregoryi]|uniref:hypothetical protein n=1 Tax=Natronobacterium gregoryi TaxID=44930 RepID=UPI001E40E32B
GLRLVFGEVVDVVADADEPAQRFRTAGLILAVAPEFTYSKPSETGRSASVIATPYRNRGWAGVIQQIDVSRLSCRTLRRRPERIEKPRNTGPSLPAAVDGVPTNRQRSRRLLLERWGLLPADVDLVGLYVF